MSIHVQQLVHLQDGLVEVAKRIEELRPWKVRIKLKSGQQIFEPLEVALSKLRDYQSFSNFIASYIIYTRDAITQSIMSTYMLGIHYATYSSEQSNLWMWNFGTLPEQESEIITCNGWDPDL